MREALLFGVAFGGLCRLSSGRHVSSVCPQHSAKSEGPGLLCMTTAGALAIHETGRTPCLETSKRNMSRLQCHLFSLLLNRLGRTPWTSSINPPCRFRFTFANSCLVDLDRNLRRLRNRAVSLLGLLPLVAVLLIHRVDQVLELLLRVLPHHATLCGPDEPVGRH